MVDDDINRSEIVHSLLKWRMNFELFNGVDKHFAMQMK